MSNELFDIANPTHLHALHDIFSDKYDCATAILGEHFQPITPESRNCEFCREIRKTETGLKICRESDSTGMVLARKKFYDTGRSEPVFYKCRHGLIDACAPIVVDGTIMGFLMGGQFRCRLVNVDPSGQSGTNNNIMVTGLDALDTLFNVLAGNGNTKEIVDDIAMSELFRRVREYDLIQFRSFYSEFSALVDSLNKFISKLRSWHKPEKAYEFLKGAIGIKNVDELFDLMVRGLPPLFDAVGASIFVVHHDPYEGDRLVLQKTSFPDLKSKEKTASYEKGQGLTGWVWANKCCLRIKNLKNHEEFKSYSGLKWEGGTHNDSNDHSSFLAVPMIAHTGEVLGVLRLPHKLGDIPFTSDDEIFLRFLADHLSKVIECQAAKDLIQQATGPSGLSIAAANIFAAYSPNEIIEAGLNSSIMLIGSTGKMHFMNLLLHGSSEWVIHNARGMLAYDGSWIGQKHSFLDGLTGKVLRRAIHMKEYEGEIVYDLKKAIKEKEYVDLVPGAQSAMAAPIYWGDHVYGAIAVASDKKYEFTRDNELRILENLAILVGIALHNYEQRRSKIIKALIGCFRLIRSLWNYIHGLVPEKM